MVTSLEDRVVELELKLDALAERLARVDSDVAPLARSQVPPVIRPAQARVSAPAQPVFSIEPEQSRPQPVLPPEPVRRAVDIEELLGGRLLALVGGLVVLVGSSSSSPSRSTAAGSTSGCASHSPSSAPVDWSSPAPGSTSGADRPRRRAPPLRRGWQASSSR